MVSPCVVEILATKVGGMMKKAVYGAPAKAETTTKTTKKMLIDNATAIDRQATLICEYIDTLVACLVGEYDASKIPTKESDPPEKGVSIDLTNQLCDLNEATLKSQRQSIEYLAYLLEEFNSTLDEKQSNCA